MQKTRKEKVVRTAIILGSVMLRQLGRPSVATPINDASRVVDVALTAAVNHRRVESTGRRVSARRNQST